MYTQRSKQITCPLLLTPSFTNHTELSMVTWSMSLILTRTSTVKMSSSSRWFPLLQFIDLAIWIFKGYLMSPVCVPHISDITQVHCQWILLHESCKSSWFVHGCTVHFVGVNMGTHAANINPCSLWWKSYIMHCHHSSTVNKFMEWDNIGFFKNAWFRYLLLLASV